MIRYIAFPALALLLACNEPGQPSGALATGDSATGNAVDPLILQKLIPQNHTYDRHFFADFDKDSVPELIVISRSPERSECLNAEDTACFYTCIIVYGAMRPGWTLLSRYKLPDFESTSVETDTAACLKIKQRLKPSGHSTLEQEDIFHFVGDSFQLKKINLVIDTKLYSGYGTDEDSWKYEIDLDTRKIRIERFQIRIQTDKSGGQELNTMDTVFYGELPRRFKIGLGNSYSLDTMLLEKDKIYFF